MDPNPEEWNHWVYKKVHNNKRYTRHIIPWLLLSVIAKLKDNAGLDLDAGPNSDFSKSELGPLASKRPPVMKKVVNMFLFSCPVVSNSLQLHGLQQASLSLTISKVCPSSCPLHWSCHSAISSSYALFSFWPQSSPASGTFPMSWLFASDDKNTGASVSASVLPTSIQGWFPLRLTGLISLPSKRLSGVFPSTTVWRHQFFGIPPSLVFRQV